MNKYLGLWLVIMCLLIASPVVALPLSTQLSFTNDSPLLSQDPSIGQLVEPLAGSSEAYTAEALSTPYSLAWVEKFVSPDLQFSFVRTFDKELSLILPQKSFSLGKAIRRQDTITVPFRYGEKMQYGSFVWVEVSEGVYTLISITIKP